MSSQHPFDAALTLTPDFDAAPDQFLGQTSPAWWNMVGPFGGVTAAMALNAVMTHPARLGEPVALTVNYASALAPGAFKMVATPAQTNRSTQHWVLSLSQTDANGVQTVALTGTAITAVRRDTWSADDLPMPAVPRPDTVARIAPPQGALEWFKRYDMRSITGHLPAKWDGSAASSDPQQASLTRLWIRDEPPRALDYTSLVAMADGFFPRIWLRRALLVPAGTVSLTVYFHAAPAQLAESGSGFLLAQARGQGYRSGFFDQTGQLWSESGTLLATTHQLVYYKE